MTAPRLMRLMVKRVLYAGALLSVHLSVRALGLTRTRKLCARVCLMRQVSRICERPSLSRAQVARSIAADLSAAAVYCPGRMTCLEQSLVLFVLLRRRQMAARFILGVRSLPFNAHAWVEVEGTPVNETPELAEGLVRLLASE